MKKLKELLAAAARNLRITAARHNHVKRVLERKRKKEEKLRRLAHIADQKADTARHEGHKQKALKLSRKATKIRARADLIKAHKATLIDQARVLHDKRHAIKVHVQDLQAQIKEAETNHGVKVDVAHNKLTGGSFEARITLAPAIATSLCSQGKRENYYDQAGMWNVRTPFTGPKRGRDRSDCSAEVTSWFFVADGPDPNGNKYTGGYTGTEVAHGHQITLSQASHCPFAQIIYGPGSGHHVELAKGDGSTRTHGHGSGPVDEGDFYMLGGEVRAFVPKELAGKV